MLAAIVSATVLGFCPTGSAARAGSIEVPLVVTDTRGMDGAITVETAEWKLVFSEYFNGGIHQWYDLAFDPGQTDNLTTASSGGFYNTGTLFDYDVYLGFGVGPVSEFMTTVGTNSNPGSLVLTILESSPARVRIRQAGHPRLNNGQGPPGDPFVELEYIDVSTIWTIYPTGKVGIDFTADVNPAGTVVDTGPGGGGKGVNAVGCCGFEKFLNATGGADFREEFTWAGDTIESVTGGWGPVQITARNSPTQLVVAEPLPAGSNLDYVIRRSAIRLETISTHADGDESIVNQCSDPAVSRWDGGSNGDPVWTKDIGDSCFTLFRDQAGHPSIADDVILAHWTLDRGAGAMLAFFEKWDGVNSGFYNDRGFTDISYTQLGKITTVFEPHHRHFLAQLGSSAATVLPTIKSVADALPYGDDYRTPFGEALVGTLASSGEIVNFGFDPGKASYEIEANASCEAVVRFDSSGGGRTGLQYKSPIIELSEYYVHDADVVVERSTDGGATFQSLAANTYNLTGDVDKASLGAGRRVFQYLSFVPASASGSSAWAFRFAGASGCSPPTTTTTQPSSTTTTMSTTTLPALPFNTKRLAFKKVTAPAGDDRIKLKSDLLLGSGIDFTPVGDGVSVAFMDGASVVWSFALGPLDPGWKFTRKYRWRPSAQGEGPSGLRRLTIGLGGRPFKMNMSVKDTDVAAVVGLSEIAVVFRMGDDIWEGALACVTSRSGNTVKCS